MTRKEFFKELKSRNTVTITVTQQGNELNLILTDVPTSEIKYDDNLQALSVGGWKTTYDWTIPLPEEIMVTTDQEYTLYKAECGDIQIGFI